MPGKAESKTTSSRIGPVAAALFDFEEAGASARLDLRIGRIIPVAPVGPQDVLILLGRVRWPGTPPIARAVAAALAERGLPPTELTDGHSQGSDRWHLIPHQGVDGKVGEFDVLIGTADFLEDAGIPLPDAIRALLAEQEAQGCWPVLIGACRSGHKTGGLRRSLIGIVSIEARSSGSDPGHAGAGSSRRPGSLPNGLPRSMRQSLWSRVTQSASRLATRRRLCVAALICVSAIAGVWLSSVTVRADELAVVQRFGRGVAVLNPGLHIRPWWPFETVTRIQPHAVRTVAVGATEPVEAAESWQMADEVMVTGDVWPAEQAASQSAPSTKPDAYSRSVPHLLRVRARVQYGIADPHAFLFNIRDPDTLVASAAASVLRATIAARSAAVCLGPGRPIIADRTARILQDRLDGMASGIAVIAVLLDAVEGIEGAAPEPAGDMVFDWVSMGITSQADGDRHIAAARVRSLKVLAAAEKDRDRRVRESHRLLDEVRATAPAYARDPDGTRRRLLIELANELPGGARQLRQVLADTMSSSRRPSTTQPGGGR